MKTEVNPKDTTLLVHWKGRNPNGGVLPSSRQRQTVKYDCIAMNVIVNNSKGWFKTTLPISFQFHHAQMDGGHGAMFMELLQREMKGAF